LYTPHKFTLQQQTLWLSPARCIYWEEEQSLILSDLHFGKSGHFRKEGIGVPQNVFKEDLQRLFTQIQFFKPKKLLIAGDMFHSEANREIELFLKWRKDIGWIDIILIKGNHDILPDNFYDEANIQVQEKKLTIKNFCFTHDITLAEDNIDDFIFSGHIHPGIRVDGNAKQSFVLPCFYFTRHYAVLPAFSMFTGLYKVKPKKGDTLFLLAENKIVSV
jgi:DNA ligase-associated metallophosphoesterase